MDKQIRLEKAYKEALDGGESGIQVTVNDKVYIHYNNGMVFDAAGNLPDKDNVNAVYLNIFRELENNRHANLARIDRQHYWLGILISVVITGSIVAGIAWDYLR